MSVSFESLAARPDRVPELVDALDPSSPADRRAALSTAQALLEAFFIPAAPLLSPSDHDPDFTAFDLQQIAGSDFPGLLTGTLGAAFPALQAPPDDRTLAPVLDEQGFEIDDPDRREAFFRAWTAQRALHVVRKLLDIIGENHPTDATVNQQELDALRLLARTPLPGIERGIVTRILAERAGGG